ncbi:Serine-protein kinase ATM [Smittium culicis]|uniref:Serine/threonine-protein kinase TEL1 n=1 Tax=Smittium culicis TaxID=133412 RepID=A0A1R1X2V9_9FUNG|nr:Serine-protein kinase ATM [Smittium culicis]
MNDSSYFLSTAIWYYARCLFVGNSHDKFATTSLVSLWLSNSNVEKAMTTLKKVGIHKIASYKWIPLVYQLCARLNDDNTEDENVNFQPILRGVITRMTVRHPYHTLPTLFALKNANNLLCSSNSTHSFSDNDKNEYNPNPLDESRNKISTQIINKVSAAKIILGNIVNAFELLFTAYIQLANTSESDAIKKDSSALSGKKKLALGRNTLISKLSENPYIPILTAYYPIDPLGKYDFLISDESIQDSQASKPTNLVTFAFIEKFYKLAGGINLPKIINVTGSDGIIYIQLVKGKDDLRQDYVIEQLFNFINDCFESSNISKLKNLKLFTYKVVPLSKRSGIVEWVQNTTPVGTWLSDSYKNMPQKIDLVKFRKEFYLEQMKKNSTIEDKLKEFSRIKNSIPPIFRVYFFNQSSDISMYFYNQKRYTISVASSSIVCWLLGIGDRHSQNILISKNSCELIHIDLGIAFNMGSLLPIPELVPFRLTQNILDGMGLLNNNNNGNSVFFEYCKDTLNLIRKYNSLINTVLNVLKHDPLYHWSSISIKRKQISSKQLMRDDIFYSKPREELNPSLNPFYKLMKGKSSKSNQANESGAKKTNNDVEDLNREAERAILSVTKRLGSELSAECVVNELIQNAIDPKNLSRMFSGWQPWL